MSFIDILFTSWLGNYLSSTWFQAFFSTFLISVAPIFILFFIPIQEKNLSQNPLLKLLLSFAAGGLLGDAFLHLIPHALLPTHHHHSTKESQDHVSAHSPFEDHSHGHHDIDLHERSSFVGVYLICGLLTFLLIEKFILVIKHAYSSPKIAMLFDDYAPSTHSPTTLSPDRSNCDIRNRKINQKKRDETHQSKKKLSADDEYASKLRVTAYLNLAADFSHNFTDGLAIGASYFSGTATGLMTTVAILFHEIPHEIGDFAILVRSGHSKRHAIKLQLVTAMGALLGTFCGLYYQNLEENTSFILPFTAGGFIYIATVSILPELLENYSNPKQCLFEALSLVAGILLMHFVSLLE